MAENSKLKQALPPVFRKLGDLLDKFVYQQMDAQVAAADGDVVDVNKPLVHMGGFDMTLGTGKANQLIHIVDDTGAAVLTVTGTFNASGNNTLTFGATGGGCTLAADASGGWTLVGHYGGTPSTV